MRDQRRDANRAAEKSGQTMTQPAINSSKRAHPSTADVSLYAVDHVRDVVWSAGPAAFDMLRSYLVTIQGDPGSGG